MTAEPDKPEDKSIAAIEKIYTETVIAHATHPRNAGSMDNYDGMGNITGPCGDTMMIWLKVEDDQIQRATFWTDGCGTSIAAGSITTEIATGKDVADALRIGQQDMLDALGGLPEDSTHCALLAANTLKKALKDYLLLKKEPWKKAYRNH
jgi:nitrogen fixation NifU-like protein